MHTLNLIVLYVLLIFSCKGSQQESIRPISVAEFEKFTKETNYLTDAEKYGWSVVQKSVFGFEVVYGANWKTPDGINKPLSKQLPVTQVSYNDAKAFCEWNNTRLPKYDEYWELIKNDKRKIVYDDKQTISSIHEVNILGNVWDITEPNYGDSSVRLAGGSLFCSATICNGVSKNAKLFVDKETGNVHIGFCVIDVK